MVKNALKVLSQPKTALRGAGCWEQVGKGLLSHRVQPPQPQEVPALLEEPPDPHSSQTSLLPSCFHANDDPYL